MITRIAIHNFRTLVNFEIKLGGFNLFMGPNGSGKTSVFDALRLLQQFHRGGVFIGNLFKKNDFTIWLSDLEFRMDLDMLLAGGDYTYSISMKRGDKPEESRVTSETLSLGGNLLYRREGQNAKVFGGGLENAQTFPFDDRLSVLNIIPDRVENSAIIAFRRCMERMIVATPNPFAMDSDAGEDNELDSSMGNFASWYRKIMHGNLDKVQDVFNALKNGPMPDFCSFSFDGMDPDVKTFNIHFAAPDGFKYKVDFKRLSSGQKMLTVLYVLLFGLKNEDACLFLDEPENFFTLREVQPWLAELRDAQVDGLIRQVTLISHHPQAIDAAGVSDAQWFYRDQGGRTQLKDYTPLLENSPLALWEHVARGDFE